ncbi:MAG: thioether cross-link-forming SCIFF peptide maturase [Bacillota bacterium]|nr:thioether cross-link-forming SCIFF peptide maturase [Bacillota bacterium]MDD4264380.1 thioether cross-link-forming SCIFF peptide maturase [Bacillota bacterium]
MKEIFVGRPENTHLFTVNGFNYVLDVPSGSLHQLDDDAYKIIEAIMQLEKESVSREDLIFSLPDIDSQTLGEVFNELQELKKLEQLFTSDEIRDNLPKLPTGLKALCLNIAHDCNLACEYCFAAKGNFGGQKALMSYEVGVKAIDMLIEGSRHRRHLEIDFFGGEPLLNFEVLKELVVYIREKEKETGKIFTLTVTTNATLLDDDKITWLNDHDILLVLSLDGRERIQNELRPTRDGRPTYKQTVERIKSAVDSREGEGYYVRGTYTRENMDFAADVLHMVKLGFRHVSIEPVVTKNEKFALREEDLQRLYGEYDRLAQAYLDAYFSGKPFNFFHFSVDLLKGPCVAKRLSGCGAGVEYIAVTPEGDIYPCHQFVGLSSFLLGSVHESGIEKQQLVSQFEEAHVYNKEACQKCWARFFCSGGCHANAYNFNGDILKPHEFSCELQRKRIECSLYIQSQILSFEQAQEAFR